jgi:hypothetical protein
MGREHYAVTVTTLTTADVVRYLSQFVARQSIVAMLPDMPRWLRRLQEYGVDAVPLAIGSASASYIDLFALQASREPRAQLMAHDVRDTLPKIRPYKGRSYRVKHKPKLA